MHEVTRHILTAIETQVWGGFADPSDVYQTIEDLLEDGADVPLLRAAVMTEFKKKEIAEATWPASTDCDRLNALFQELNEGGIIALQNAGYTMSDGHSDVGEELQRRDRGSVKGYCFYHGQDLERAVAGAGLLLAYGDLRNTSEGKIEIGKAVKAAAERHDFEVLWEGTHNRRIELPNIDWKRRRKLPRPPRSL